MLAMPWIATGVFVYQSFISDSKMWNIYTIPKAFMVYSLASIITLFFSGFLVDKFTSRKLIPILKSDMDVNLVAPEINEDIYELAENYKNLILEKRKFPGGKIKVSDMRILRKAVRFTQKIEKCRKINIKIRCRRKQNDQ